MKYGIIQKFIEFVLYFILFLLERYLSLHEHNYKNYFNSFQILHNFCVNFLKTMLISLYLCSKVFLRFVMFSQKIIYDLYAHAIKLKTLGILEVSIFAIG